MGFLDWFFGRGAKLSDQLRDKDVYVREAAAEALLAEPSPVALVTLRELMDSSDTENERLRCTVAAALGKAGDQRAVEPLARAMMRYALTKQHRTAVSAARALRTLGWQPRDAQERAVCALIEERTADAAEEGVAVLEALLLKKRNPEDERCIFDDEGDITEDGWVAVLRALLSPATSGAPGAPGSRAIEQFSGAPRQLLVARLEMPALWSSDKPEFQQWRAALVESLGDAAIEPLIRLLPNYNHIDGCSERVSQALLGLGPGVVPPLLRALHGIDTDTNNDNYTRSKMIRLLTTIGDPSAAAPLAAFVEHPNEYVRDAAVTALEHLGGDVSGVLRAVLQNPQLPYDTRAFAIGKLVGSGQSCDVEAVAHALQDPDLRLPAALALIQRNDPPAREVLAQHFEGLSMEDFTKDDLSAEWKRGLSVAAALANRGDACSVGVLMAHVSGAHREIEEREEEDGYIEYLQRSIEALQNLLARAPGSVDRADLEALRSLGDLRIEVWDMRREWAPEVRSFSLSILREAAIQEIARRDGRAAATQG
jgi:HEAT repeat protein